MRKFLFVVCTLLACNTAFAASHAFGNKLVVDGDSTGKVIQVAGQPDRIVTLENTYGAAAGERWEYYRDGGTIMITFNAGKVVSIEVVR